MSTKIIASLIAIAAVAAVAGGATVAYFSDAEKSEGNTFAAGTMDLKVDGVNWATAVWNLIDLKPSDTDFKTLALSNSGTIGGNVNFVIAVSENKENLCGSDSEKDVDTDCDSSVIGELCAATKVKVSYDGDLKQDWISISALTAQTAGTPLALGVLGATPDSKNLLVEYEIPTTVGNEIQSDSCKFDMTATLNQ